MLSWKEIIFISKLEIDFKHIFHKQTRSWVHTSRIVCFTIELNTVKINCKLNHNTTKLFLNFGTEQFNKIVYVCWSIIRRLLMVFRVSDPQPNIHFAIHRYTDDYFIQFD